MRRFFIGLAIAALAAVGPSWVLAGDPEIAQQVIAKLEEQKKSGQLKGFKIGVSVKEGQVWLKGRTSSPEQHAAVLKSAQTVPGVKSVVDLIEVDSAAPAAAAQPAVSAATPFASLLGGGSAPSATNASSRRVARTAPEPIPAKPAAAPQVAAQQPAVNPYAGSQSVAMGSKEPSVAVHPLPNQPVHTADFRGQSDLHAQAQAIPADAPPANARFTAATQEPYHPAAQPQSVRTQAEPQYEGQIQPVAAPQPRSVVQRQPMVAYPQQRIAAGNLGPRQPTVPMAYAPARQVNYQPGVEHLGQPIPAYNPAMGGGVAPARYDHPRMPGYAWPSYAAYPNYAAVTYPRQYSPTAWPYIGPFYPYPQVPLGWRKVTLEWDDGWWMLDFKQK